MKTLLYSLLAIGLTSLCDAQNVNIPDGNFKNALISAGVDKNGDSLISYTECEAVKKLDVNSKSISDLTGIEAFVNLDTLDCGDNELTSLDVSGCVALKYLSCYWNQLTSLDVSKNTKLTGLSCWQNQLNNLDVSGCILLTGLLCHINQLTKLDVSACTALTELVCWGNPLADLDVSKNTALSDLKCGDSLTSLDLSNNTALRLLQCNCKKLTSLDVSNNILLEWLECPGGQLTSLSIPKNSALKNIDCRDNQLTSLDVSGNDSLKYLNCELNLLTSLNLSRCYSLLWLNCQGNQLTSLDVSDNENVRQMYLSNMPMLYQVCVWEIPLDIAIVHIDKTGSPNIVYTIDCWIQSYVNIPDRNFKNTLRSTGVDTDNNRKISYAEAEAVTYLDVSGKDISDMTGIESFVNLEVLDCAENRLTTLDVSGNTALKKLYCSYNFITRLDVTECTLLSRLSCSNNRLKYLNISNNRNLLDCEGDSCNAVLDLSNMPTLYGVCVWEMPFPPADKIEYVDTTGSPNVFFSTDCSVSVQDEYIKISLVNIYPNPSDDVVHIAIKNPHNAILEIYSIRGTWVFGKVLDSGVEKIDISGFPRGVYIVKVKQGEKVIAEKVVKK
jgi:hypothetical protein